MRSQILNSTKGRRGGFSFAVPTNNISLIDIVNIIDGPHLSRTCALGFPECGNDDECPIHEQWGVTLTQLKLRIITERFVYLKNPEAQIWIFDIVN